MEMKWHKYPDELPPDNKRYIVSVKLTGSKYATTCLSYSCEYDEQPYDTRWLGWKVANSVRVNAWMELPEPYKED